MKSREGIQIGWCPGCGLHTMFKSTCDTIKELNLTEKTTVVSGIGCTGRGAAYFNTDSIHAIHGRAIPLAVGIKTANPELNVIVFSGDGDLLGIGGNHLIHAARRNDNITVLCNNNAVFGMTGGQAAPTAPTGRQTSTTPKGNISQPMNVQSLILSNGTFYARSSPMFSEHLKKVLKEAMLHKGFSFVDLITPCILNYPKSSGKSMGEVIQEVRQNFTIKTGNELLEPTELGIVKK